MILSCSIKKKKTALRSLRSLSSSAQNPFIELALPLPHCTQLVSCVLANYVSPNFCQQLRHSNCVTFNNNLHRETQRNGITRGHVGIKMDRCMNVYTNVKITTHAICVHMHTTHGKTQQLCLQMSTQLTLQ